MSGPVPAGSSYPRTARALKPVLAAAALKPRRRHGQHFLTDPQAVDAIVRDAGCTEADHVVEVGTGVGLLTHALAETGARVTSFEVDGVMLAFTKELVSWPERVRFVEGDVLAGKHALAPAFRAALGERPAPPGRLLLVSNLPYGAGTPIVLDVLALPAPPDELVVMLQREVVEKLLAPAGSTAYGAPSVAVALNAEGLILRRFGPEVFWPRPRVRSAVVRLVPRRAVPLAPDEHRAFGEFTTALFCHRRKVLASTLRFARPGLDASLAHAALEALGLAASTRVEQVRPEVLLALWRHVARG